MCVFVCLLQYIIVKVNSNTEPAVYMLPPAADPIQLVGHPVFLWPDSVQKKIVYKQME